jgi:putative endonuclease
LQIVQASAVRPACAATPADKTARQAGLLMKFTYVYILESITTSEHFYIGSCNELDSRLTQHNKGEVFHTSKFRPWKIKVAVAFENSEKAKMFERYLKTGSGREFTKRHF